MCYFFTDEGLKEGHVLHAWAQQSAQSLSRVRFGFCQQVELVAALAADVTHAVVAFVVLLVVALLPIME